MITKLLVSAAVSISALMGAAPASADNPADSSPFAALTAPVERTTVPGPGLMEELEQGILAALRSNG